MDAAENAFFNDLIDYAGTFPPASCDLDQAFANYLRFQHGNAASLLGRFVCPVGLFNSLPQSADEHEAIRVAALLSAVTYAGGIKNFLDVELAACARLRGKSGGRRFAATVECKLSAELAAIRHRDAVGTVLSGVAHQLEHNHPHCTAFVEVEFGGAQRDNASWSAAMDQVTGQLAELGGAIGLKLRTGGPSAREVPSAQQLALGMTFCAKRKIPLKLVSGLYEPFAQVEDGRVLSHGILNVVGAAILVHARGIDGQTVAEFLADSDGSDFQFTGDVLTWRGLHASAQEIRQTRQELLFGISSALFDEPVQRLRERGLLS
ncbi:MAG: hypothetical protein KDD44_03965 [Bdellovibrionales bacterium]|nr:hypothetical protein [Bdellovibrionales bacterium]